MRKSYRFPRFYSLVPLLILLISGSIAIRNYPSQKSERPAELDMQKLSDKPGLYPADWMERQRTYPYGTIRTDVYLNAVRQGRDLHAAGDRASYTWEFAGPTNIGGRVTDIEIPSGTTSVIFVAAASGGILKSTDGGLSWKNVFSNQPVIPVGDIAIDPGNPDLMYAGTGEANSSSQSFRGDGIYRSVDGGETWQHSGLDEAAYFGRIIIDYSNSDRVYAAACGNLFTPDGNRGIYRTTDGGNSWQRVLFITDSTSGIDIVQDPASPDILYAAMWERMRGLNYRRSFGPSSGIWKTTDGGDTWTPLTTGLPQGNGTGRIGLAVSPTNPLIVYAFYDNETEVAVYKTTNGGQSWSRTNDGALQGMNSNFGWYFGQIRVSPVNPDQVYVMGVYLLTSSNGGNSWSEKGSEMHVDHHAMFISPVTGRIYEGNDGGLYYSDNTGNSWNKINNLPLTQFYDIETDRLTPARLYGGTQDNNSIRTWTGQTNDWQAILGGDGFYSLVDYTNSNTIYAEYQYGALHRSTNGGNSMTAIYYSWSSDRVNWSAPVVMHPVNSQTLYFGTYRVWKTTNRGSTWTAVSGDLTKGGDGSSYHTLTTLAVSPLEPDIVLAGSDDGKVHISTNGGSVWTDISAGLPDRWVTRVAADPFDVNTIYATLSGFRWDEPLPHIFRSTDLGQTWEPVSTDLPDLPVNAFIADPGQQGRLFAGTDAGVFMSKDAGESWQSLNEGLANVPVTCMKIHPDMNFLVIGTYGLSAYKLDLNQLNVGVNSFQPPQSGLSLGSIYPNPCKTDGSGLHLTIGSSNACTIRMRISTIHGSVIRTITGVSVPQGLSEYVWDGTDDAGHMAGSGTYLIHMEDGSSHANAKVLLIN